MCTQRYDYFYEVKDTTKGGDGKTYSYNLWNGVQQVRISVHKVHHEFMNYTHTFSFS